MANWFSFNGALSTSLGVIVQTFPPVTLPEERAQFEPIPGRSGSLTILEGDAVYDDIILSVECRVSDLTNIDQIAAWLRGSGDLVLGNMPDRYYKARCVNQIEIAKVLRGREHRTFPAVFRCSPYRYTYPAYTAYQIAATVKTIAAQAGTGTPSPTNIRAISGKATVKVTVDGVDTTLTPDATLYGLTGYEDEISAAGAVTHKTQYMTLTGSESASITEFTNHVRAIYNLGGAVTTGETASICSHLPYLYNSTSDTPHYYYDGNKWLAIFIPKSVLGAYTLAGVQTWLAAQVTAGTPVQFVRRLYTPATATVAAKVIYHVNNTDVVTTDGASITATYTGVASTVYTASPASIVNPGTADATPIITAVGSGDIDLTIGTRTIHIEDLASSITIDTDTGFALNGSTDLTSTVTFDDYPWTIPPGTAAIAWTGTVTSVTLTCPWRYI